MGQAVVIIRTDLMASALRAAACRSEEVAQSRRLLAITLVLEGGSRSQAAAQTGMDRRGWTGRRFGIGRTATTKLGLKDCGRGAVLAARRR